MNEIVRKLDNVYEERLIGVRKNGTGITREEVEILLDYIKDLREQNLILIEAVDELEKETQSRVLAAEKLLEQTASAKDCMLHVHKYCEIVNSQHKTTRFALQEAKKWQEKCRQLEDFNGSLQHDISSLVKLITHARNTGRWDVGNLDFCEVSFEEVFGSVEKLSTSSVGEWSILPYNQYNRCDGSVASFTPKQDICDTSFRLSNSSFANLDSTSSISPNLPTPKDALIVKIQLELKQSKQQLTSLQHQILEKDKSIVELQMQLADIQHDLAVQGNECFAHTAMLDEVREQMRKDRIEISRLQEICKKSQHSIDQYIDDNDSVMNLEVLKRCNIQMEKMLDEAAEKIAQLQRELNESRQSQLNNSSDLRDSQGTINRTNSLIGQTDAEVEEIKRLQKLEEQHRKKADGLEMVVNLLNQKLSGYENKNMANNASEANNDVAIKNLENERDIAMSQKENYFCKFKDLEEQIVKANRDSFAYLDEIENQRITISNLQEALVSVKKGGNGNYVKSSNSSLVNAKSQSDVFDI